MPHSWQLIQFRHHQSEQGAPVMTFHRGHLACRGELALGSQILYVPTDRILRIRSGASPLNDCALYVESEPIHR